MSHTKGPWTWDDTVWDYDPAEQAPWLVTDDARADEVLWGEIKCGEADARLIAAAPDLLEAVERAVRYAGGNPDGDNFADTMAALVRAAQKARGAS